MDRKEIYISYGNEAKTMVEEILSKVDITKEIGTDRLIGIKPNLVLAKPSSSGATTSPELVARVIEHLQSKGYKNIVILEGSWIGDKTSKAFKVCGYEEISERYQVPLIDLQKDGYKAFEVNGIEINVCDKALEVDYLINMPVLKGHCQTKLTCALKNLKGCIPNSEKRRFHTMGLHKPIGYLNKVIKSDLIIVDGIMGDLNYEEGGNPVEINRVLVGKDPVLIDAFAAELIGYALEDIEYIKIAEEAGIGSADIESAKVLELNKNFSVGEIKHTNRVQQLARFIVDKEACSACYGSLIHALERLDEKGLLHKLEDEIYIGQGYRDQEGDNIGIGLCTKSFKKNIPGCPPKARDIVNYLEKVTRN